MKKDGSIIGNAANLLEDNTIWQCDDDNNDRKWLHDKSIQYTTIKINSL